MTKQATKVSVLGAGWLGLPLSKALIAQGYTVKGSTTTAEKLALLSQNGVAAYLLSLEPQATGEGWEEFLDTDILIVNIPPQTRRAHLPPDFHPKQIESLLDKMNTKPPKKLLYVSATSVYPDVERIVTEQETITGQNTPNPALWNAEQLLQSNFGGKLIILRLGGLLGEDRIPGRYFAGKKDLTTGSVPVNFIHQADAIGVIQALMDYEGANTQEIFNAVSPEHPPRKVIYERNAADFGFEAPTFVETPPKGYKIISTDKLLQTIKYHFKYPNPVEYRYKA